MRLQSTVAAGGAGGGLGEPSCARDEGVLVASVEAAVNGGRTV